MPTKLKPEYLSPFVAEIVLALSEGVLTEQQVRDFSDACYMAALEYRVKEGAARRRATPPNTIPPEGSPDTPRPS